MLREIKDKNPQLERWSIQLAEYDYKIEYRAGKNNVVADGLSRKLKIEVIKITYKPSHFSIRRTFSKPRDKFYWKKIYKEVREYTKSCITCQKRNSRTKHCAGELQIIEADDVNDLVGIDILSGIPVSKEGYNNIVVITDYYSKYSVAIPSRSKEAEEVVNIFFRNWCMIFGVPAAVWEYNNSKHEGTRAAPYLMMFMRKPRWEEGYVIEGRVPEENAYIVCKVVHGERYLLG
eukprot:TRINITY_DN1224_c0_g1_i35.p1 TRINITY_DN1224_c0_g1~~TRINITY_DN1224_c0_g1_i35.p1  ORF type:complete len:233 (+),score=29.98 TRINITY_DN1224_c0_g1_i35:1227-1925(+)